MHNSTDRTTTSDWPYPSLVSHRCGGTLAPENTLPGFDVCLQYGCTMVEFDAKLSADDHVFLLHDDTLERTTNGRGPAADASWDALARLDAGSWHGASYAGVQLPSLAAVAARCARDGILANIEIKPCPGRDAHTGTLVARSAATLWQSMTPPLLSSFSIEALAAARIAAPELPRGMLFDALPHDWLAIASELECVSVHVNHHHLTEPQAAAIRAAGLHLLTYTVNDAARAQQLMQWGVDMICTDRIDLLSRLHRA